MAPKKDAVRLARETDDACGDGDAPTEDGAMRERFKDLFKRKGRGK
jgi:hypothetical protein